MVARQVDNRQALRLLDPEYASVDVAVIPDERTPEQIAEDKATYLQAMSEGVDLPVKKDPEEGRTIERKVKLSMAHPKTQVVSEAEFRIADHVGLMPLMEFAFHANSGLDTGDMGAMAAIYEMLKDCIHEDEWDEFRAFAKKCKADEDALLKVVQQTTELLTARPTQQGSGSSALLPSTSGSLTAISSNRPEGLTPVADLANVV